MMQNAHRQLAAGTNARLVNVGKVWEFLHQSLPDLTLTSDSNHPTAAASYFLALCLYADLSGNDVSPIRWAPDEISEANAAKIREVVDQYRTDL
ncbi:hypothetical protein [Sphingobium sp. EM0848]|uniref:hypothetical protein n=1 Tax=Sphingobium sp. EM0848 TaxID=2743473 RepID=UPI00159C6214|nr:hypothetical protein [Sphingobium sp. EM0848]